jgi:hypothetical protein
MSELSINQATSSDLTNVVTDYSVDTMQTDGATGQDETEWVNSKWSQQWGYFNSVPDLKSALIQKAIWNVGKGWTADAETRVILEHITGWGKDTFDDILFNAEIIKRVGGDFFAEIIRDEETGILLNLKPLDPSSIKIIVDKKGIIKRYEQINKLSKEPAKFKPEEIFHLSNNRLADQIHGISDIDAVESIILAEGESFTDMKWVMHRQAKPLIMFKLGTDDQTKINTFITKMDTAVNKGENIYIPDDENAVSYEVVQVNPASIIVNWRDDLRKKFYRTIGLPELLPSGGGDATESGGKIGYLAFEQVVEKSQRELELQIWQQLGLKIDLYPPATLQANLQVDNRKDASQGLGFQYNETTAGVGQ